MDIWFVVFDHDKFLPQWFLERLPPNETIMSLMIKITGGENDGPLANVKTSDVEVWKFKSLKLAPRGKQMDELLNNLVFTDSDIELVDARTMIEELRLVPFEPLLVRRKGKYHLFLYIMFPTKLCLK